MIQKAKKWNLHNGISHGGGSVKGNDGQGNSGSSVNHVEIVWEVDLSSERKVNVKFVKTKRESCGLWVGRVECGDQHQLSCPNGSKRPAEELGSSSESIYTLGVAPLSVMETVFGCNIYSIRDTMHGAVVSLKS